MNIIRLNSIGEPFAKSEQATPPSGGGTEASSMEYLDVTGFLEGALPFICSVALNVKWDSLGNSSHTPIVISPFYLVAPNYKEDYSGYNATILAIAIDFNLKVCNTMVGGELISIGDYLTSQGLMELLSACPRLTKEQFYTL